MARRKNKFKLIRSGFLLMLFLVLGSGAIVNQASLSNPTETNVIFPGTKVLGVDLSNLTKQDAIAKLAELEQELLKKQVRVTYQGVAHDVTLGAMGLTLDGAKTIDQALAHFNKIGLIKRWQSRLHLTEQQPAVINLDRDMTKAVLQKIVNPLYIPAVNARLTVNSQEQVGVEPSQEGFHVDIDKFRNQLIELLNNNHSLALELPATKINPELSTEEVTQWGVTGLLSQYTTQFNPTLAGRTQNIKISADILDDLIVPPEEIVSFNQVVGPRVAEKGYQNAGVIVGNTLTEGLGGGICQVVTTLYNAVLLADLDIIQRGNHNIPITYAPIGLDAAVAYDALDFKFKNNSSNHLLIKTSMHGNSLTIKIYGNDGEKNNVQLESWIVETIEPKVVYKVDPDLEPEESKMLQEGAQGYRVKAQRVVTVDGKEIRRDALPDSYYLPVEQIIAVQSETQIPGHETEDKPTDGPIDSPTDEPVDLCPASDSPETNLGNPPGEPL
ncbi:VanW family protein [Desulfoscipio gibsoniae]|uniref:Putative vancomycin resistance protein n=1 Tax=Desulfoscipio gibsoniae DSM 7213 TaxID=767817 RepID=R4KBR6_9FIRM|nr:VanW family protein [Desulfoscipio gibsoniae]AGL00628.1 putative vancomycin resistance protein [Desulfoscipio gibsoniae DSM 7213]